MNKKILFVIVLVFSFFLIPRANAQVTRFQIFNYNNGSFTNTYDTSALSGSIGGGFGIGGTNTRITFDDTLQINHNYTLTLTLTFESSPNSWFRWGQNAMSGVLIGSGYIVTSPSSGTTILNRYSGQYCIGGGPACWDFYRKQSTINFTFKPTSVSNTWSVNIPFDSTQFKYYSIDSYLLQDSGNSDSQAIINNQNINTQNIINSQNNTTNAINEVNDTIQDTTIDDNLIGGKLGEITSISDTPITDLLTLPITLLQRIYASINSSCRSYSLPFGFGLTDYTLNLPCIDLGHEKYFGRVVWGAIDDLICILMVFVIFKMVIWFYSSWTTLKDNFMYLIDPSNGGLF